MAVRRNGRAILMLRQAQHEALRATPNPVRRDLVLSLSKYAARYDIAGDR